MKKNAHSWLKKTMLLLIAGLIFALAGCEMIKNIDFPWDQLAGVPTKTPVSPKTTATQAPTPTPVAIQATPTTPPNKTRLVLWLPPEFDPYPEESNPAAQVLAQGLAQFARDNAIDIEVRLKGPESEDIINSLTATSAAAPGNLPAVVLVSRDNLAKLKVEHLIYPNDELQSAAENLDWYGFACETIISDDISYGVGLLGDPLIMAYRSQAEITPDFDWFQIQQNYGYFSFAADDPQARFLFMLYLATGGNTHDDENHLTLQREPLTSAFQLISDIEAEGHLSYLAQDLQDPASVWQGFANWSADTAAMPASAVLKALASDETGYPEPLFTQPAFTLTESWALVLTTSDESQQALGISLMRHLADSTFLAAWSEALGYVPARRSALDAWQNENLKVVLEEIMDVARLYPRDETLEKLGPHLQEAALMIIRDEATVEEAVEAVLQALK